MVAQDRQAAPRGRVRGAGSIEDLIQRNGGIEVEQRIEASPDTVFEYLIDPRRFVLWMGARAELDPRLGGKFRIDVDGVHIASGEYREIDPPHRLVMTWGWESDPEVPPGSTIVEITLLPDGAHTLLRLRHTGLPTDGQRRNHRAGWEMYTGKLAAVLA